MPYTVPKLTDFSAAALDGAVRELLSALEQESAALVPRMVESISGSLDGAQELAFLRTPTTVAESGPERCQNARLGSASMR